LVRRRVSSQGRAIRMSSDPCRFLRQGKDKMDVAQRLSLTRQLAHPRAAELTCCLFPPKLSAGSSLRENRLNRLRKNSNCASESVRARLQSCRKCRRMSAAFRPCGAPLWLFAVHSGFFRSLSNPSRRIAAGGRGAGEARTTNEDGCPGCLAFGHLGEAQTWTREKLKRFIPPRSLPECRPVSVDPKAHGPRLTRMALCVK